MDHRKQQQLRENGEAGEWALHSSATYEKQLFNIYLEGNMMELHNGRVMERGVTMSYQREAGVE